MTYQERINATTNLDELRSTLTSIESEISIENDSRTFHTNIGEHVDLAGLPTFGGVEPTDTLGIYSWDATRILTAYGSEWEIGSR
jgi:hypothetical protein